jgi:hypothetical protein
MKPGPNPWSDDSLGLAMRMRDEGADWEDIARAVGRSAEATRLRVNRERWARGLTGYVPPPQVQPEDRCPVCTFLQPHVCLRGDATERRAWP